MARLVRTALDGLGGFSAHMRCPPQLRERIAGDVQAVADPVVMERLTATGQIANFGGRIPGVSSNSAPIAVAVRDLGIVLPQ